MICHRFSESYCLDKALDLEFCIWEAYPWIVPSMRHLSVMGRTWQCYKNVRNKSYTTARHFMRPCEVVPLPPLAVIHTAGKFSAYSGHKQKIFLHRGVQTCSRGWGDQVRPRAARDMNHRAAVLWQQAGELHSLMEAATICWRECKSSKEKKNTNVNAELKSTGLCTVRLLGAGKRPCNA